MKMKLGNTKYFVAATLTVLPKKIFAMDWIVCENPPNCNFEEFMLTLNLILGNLLRFAVLIVVITFVAAGWTYMTSAGNASKVQKAHKMLTMAAIGFAIMLSAFLIVELITSTLGLDSAVIELIK
jgi:hypothetical protein